MKSLPKIFQKWHFRQLPFLLNILLFSSLLLVFSCRSEETKSDDSIEKFQKDDQTTASFKNYKGEIIVEHPAPGEEISSPMTIRGEARGSWFFEASAPFELLSEKGEVLAEGSVTATEEWMIENFVPFEAEVRFQKPNSTTGFLVLKNANPSGLPEQEKTIKIPVIFSD